MTNKLEFEAEYVEWILERLHEHRKFMYEENLFEAGIILGTIMNSLAAEIVKAEEAERADPKKESDFFKRGDALAADLSEIDDELEKNED